MRDWSPTEIEILSHLAAASSRPPVRLEHLLEEVFFSEREGRSLVLQPARYLAVFYLEPKTFDDEAKRLEALRRLAELMLLLAYLSRERSVVINRDPPALEQQIRFVGTLFREPRRDKARIVLNERGDYTVRPEVILSKEEAVVSRGVRLSGDLYDLVANNTRGLVYVSPAIKGWLPGSPSPSSATHAVLPRLQHSSASAQTPPALPPVLPLTEAAPRPNPLLRSLVRWPLLLVSMCAAAWLTARSTLGMARRAAHAPANLEAVSPDAASAPASNDTGSVIRPSGATSAAASQASPTTSRPTAAAGLIQDAASVIRGDPSHTYGVDVSLYSGPIDFVRARAAGLAFVFVKASEGLTIQDPQFAEHWSAAGRASLLRGAYHYFIATDDGLEQAKHFLVIVGAPDADDLPPAVDVEEKSQLESVSVEVSLSRLQTFLATVQRRLHRTPVIYSSARVWKAYLKDAPGFGAYPLWVAFYQPAAADPPLPPVWRKWTFWQFTDAAIVPGASSRLNFSRFNGGEASLRTFAKAQQL